MVRFAVDNGYGQSQRAGSSLPTVASILGQSPDEGALGLAPSPDSGAVNRPYANVGKMPLNLVDTIRPGSSLDEAPQEKPAGIVPSLFGQAGALIGGMFGKEGQKVGHDIGYGIGDVLDAPFDEMPGIPLFPMYNSPFSAVNNMTPEEKKAMEAQMGASAPWDWMGVISDATSKSFQRNVEAGRVNPIWAPYQAPTVSFGQQVMTILSTLGLAGQLVERTYANLAQRDKGVLEYKGDDQFLKGLHDQYISGAFGEGDTARDRVLDELTANGRGFTDDWAANMFWSMVTDPLVLLGGGLGAVAKSASGAERLVYAAGTLTKTADGVKSVMNAGRFLSAFASADDRVKVMNEVVELVQSEKGLATTEDAIRLINSQPLEGYRAMAKVAEQYPAQYGEAMKNLSYMQNWSLKWEPKLRPITDIVRKINDPITMFGSGHAGKVMNGYLSAGVTEGVMRAYGLDNVVGVLDGVAASSPALRKAMEDGIGTYTANVTRWIMRRKVVRDIRKSGVRPEFTPDEMISARLSGVKGDDIASSAEMFALRVMPQYNATGRGLAAQALEVAQKQAASRLRMMDRSLAADEAMSLAKKMNAQQVALVDAAYYGHAIRSLNVAKKIAMRVAGAPKDVERLTIIGSRELTKAKADELLEIIASKSPDRVQKIRDAVQTYDLLYENFAEGNLSADELLSKVTELIKAHHDDLVQEIVDATPYGKSARDWLRMNKTVGYRLGIGPEAERMWREVTEVVDDELVVKSVNPWVEAVDEASAVPALGRWDIAKDAMFHRIRGERIVLEARQAFNRLAANDWGLAKGESDGLFSRLMVAASEQGITPRGLSQERVYNIVMTHHLSDYAMSKITDREAIELFVRAFEGKTLTVGVTQKATGIVKSGLSRHGNPIGRMAENVYPMVRFTLNPLFQMQEAVEPFILSIMRGLKPGFRPDDIDRETLRLVQHMMRDGRYALDDQIEYGDLLLWGEISGKEGFGPTTRIGKLAQKLTFNGAFNIKRMKQTNYARLIRRQLGDEFHEAVLRTSPALWDSLVGHYGTTNKGLIALKWLTERAVWTNSDPATIRAMAQAILPGDLGRRTAISMDDVARVMRKVAPDEFKPEYLTSGKVLKMAVASGEIKGDDIERVLKSFGADPDYIRRARSVATMKYTVDEWFDAYRTTFAKGNGHQTALVRALYQALANAKGETLEEYLAHRFRATPWFGASEEIASLTPAELASVRLQRDIPKAILELAKIPGLKAFRAEMRGARHEAAYAYGADGKIIGRWVGGPNSVTPRVREDGALKDANFVHNHPWFDREMGNAVGAADLTGDLTFSGADIYLAMRHDLASIRAESPGWSYVITRPEGGWTTPLDHTLVEVRRTVNGVEKIDHVAASSLEFHKELSRYANEWKRDILPTRSDLSPNIVGQGGEPTKWLIDREAQDYAIAKMADKYGFSYERTFDPYLSDDRWIDELFFIAQNPPQWLRDADPAQAFSAPLSKEMMLIDGVEHPVLIPGGFERTKPFTYWEQQILKAQGIRTDLLWESNADHVLDLYGRMWAAHEKDPSDVYNVIHAMIFSGLSPRTNLTVTEAAFTRMRQMVPSDGVRSVGDRQIALENLASKAGEYEGRLPERLYGTKDEAAELGRMFQLEHGYYQTVDSESASTLMDAGKLDKAMAAAMRGEEEAQRLIAEGVSPYDAYLTATKLIANDAEGVTIMGRSWAEHTTGGRSPLRNWFVSPATNFRAVGTNTQWGQAIQWARDLLKMRDELPDGWLGRQPDETPIQHAFRIAAVTRGLDAKTGLFAMDMLGPGTLDAGIIDTITTKLIAIDLLGRDVAEREAFLASLSTPYRAHLEERMVLLERGRVYVSASDAAPGTTGNALWGLRQPGGAPVRGNAAIGWNDPRIPDEVYHVTTAKSAVAKEGRLRAGGVGGLGGDNRDRIVSMTTSREVGEALQSDMRLMASLWNEQDPIARLTAEADADGWGDVWRKEVERYKGFGVDPVTKEWSAEGEVSVRDAARTFFQYRTSNTTKKNPLFFGDSPLKGVDPNEIEMLTIPKQNLDNGALLTDFDLNNPQGLSEVRSYGDVSIAGRKQQAKVSFNAPNAEPVRLLSGARGKLAKDREKTLAQMRAALEDVFPDPKERALYDNDHVLEMIANNNDGVISRWGGDYALMDEYLTGMKNREAMAHERVADLSNAQYQWLIWDRDRGGFDPHAIMSKDVEYLPNMPDLGISEAMDTLKAQGFNSMAPLNGRMADPRLTMMLQKIGSNVLGATITTDDARRIMLATQHADVTTGIHELAHVMAPDLDRSAELLISREYKKATGIDTRGRLTKEAEEWYADQFIAYVGNGAAPSPELRATFEYFRKWIGAVYSTVAHDEESAVFKTTRKTEITEARAAVAAGKKSVRAAQGVLHKAQQRVRTAANNLRRERSRMKVEALEKRHVQLTDKVTTTKTALKTARSEARAANAEHAKVRAANPPREEVVPVADPETPPVPDVKIAWTSEKASVTGTSTKTYRSDIEPVEVDTPYQTEPETAVAVQTWYDRSTRSWVTRLVDENGAQVGDSVYTATRSGADMAANDLVRNAYERRAKLWESMHPSGGPAIDPVEQAKYDDYLKAKDAAYAEHDARIEQANSDAEQALAEDDKPGRDFADFWRDREDAAGRPIRNARKVEAELNRMENEGIDVSEAWNALSDWDGMDRSDAADAEEWADMRTDAWNELCDAIENAERNEALDPPRVERTGEGTYTVWSGKAKDSEVEVTLGAVDNAAQHPGAAIARKYVGRQRRDFAQMLNDLDRLAADGVDVSRIRKKIDGLYNDAKGHLGDDTTSAADRQRMAADRWHDAQNAIREWTSEPHAEQRIKIGDAIFASRETAADELRKHGLSQGQIDALFDVKLPDPVDAPVAKAAEVQTETRVVIPQVVEDALSKKVSTRARARSLNSELGALRSERASNGAKLRGAKRRKPMATVEAAHKKATEEAAAAGKALKEAEDTLKAAQKRRDDALSMRAPKRKTVRPAISSEMKGMFDTILKPTKLETVPKRNRLATASWNAEEESVYAAAENAFLKAEEQAFTTHYYRRGRSFLERSVNHPYLGMYPFSYMWGKMLPEMVRFLVKEPFGLWAPGAGLIESQHIYRSVMLQKEHDPEFRDWLAKSEPAFRFASMMVPALPWEIPVNAPLWARRVAESESMYQARQARGDIQYDENGIPKPPGMTGEQFGSTLSDVATYAFGPAQSAKLAGQAFGLFEDTSQAFSETLQSVFGQGGGIVPQIAPGSSQ